jgi:hypothetical protein
MEQLLVVTGVDEPEAALGLDVTRMFCEMGLSKGRQVEFYAVQDHSDDPEDWLPERKIRSAYQEVDRVVALHNPRVFIDLHHALVDWDHFEVQVFSGLCAESSAFQTWATGLTDVLVRAGGSDDYDKAIFCYQLPSVRDRLWFDMEYIQVEVIPSLAPVKERMKIPEAPLARFEFPGGATYQREIELLAHVLAGIYDHHPWLTAAESTDERGSRLT